MIPAPACAPFTGARARTSAHIAPPARTLVHYLRAHTHTLTHARIAELEKKLRNVTKKLRQIDQLMEKQAAGEFLQVTARAHIIHVSCYLLVSFCF